MLHVLIDVIDAAIDKLVAQQLFMHAWHDWPRPVHVRFMWGAGSLAQPCHSIPQRLAPVAVPDGLQAAHVVPLKRGPLQLGLSSQGFCCLYPLLHQPHLASAQHHNHAMRHTVQVCDGACI